MAAVAKPFEGIKLAEFQKRKLDRDRLMVDEGFHHAGHPHPLQDHPGRPVRT